MRTLTHVCARGQLVLSRCPIPQGPHSRWSTLDETRRAELAELAELSRPGPGRAHETGVSAHRSFPERRLGPHDGKVIRNGGCRRQSTGFITDHRSVRCKTTWVRACASVSSETRYAVPVIECNSKILGKLASADSLQHVLCRLATFWACKLCGGRKMHQAVAPSLRRVPR